MSGPLFKDRVKETGTVSGAGPIALQGAMTGGFFPFSTIGDGNWCYATILDGAGNEETVEATYAASTNALTVGTVLSSTNAGSQVSFPAGSNVTAYLTVPAAWYTAIAAGTTVLSGGGAVERAGANGDFYIDTTAEAIYGPKTGGAWGSATSLIGPAGTPGTAGTNGTNGTNGATWWSGSGGAELGHR